MSCSIRGVRSDGVVSMKITCNRGHVFSSEDNLEWIPDHEIEEDGELAKCPECGQVEFYLVRGEPWD